MDKLLTQNMIFVALIVEVVGSALNCWIFSKLDKLRKWLLPLILCILGVGLMCLVCYLNKDTHYGNAAIQGLVSSTFCQFIYDKYHDVKGK